MIFLGIDGGKRGAIAALNELPESYEVFPMPIITSKMSRDEYDPKGIIAILKRFPDAFVTVEKAKPLPMIPSRPGPSGRMIESKFKPGSLAQFNRGVQRAGFEWVLHALEMSFQLVDSRQWMKVMHLGTPDGETKQRSIIAAQRLFPTVDLRRSQRARKPDDGIAEALLLAEYGRRTRNGSN